MVCLISGLSNQQLIQSTVPRPLSSSWGYTRVSAFPDVFGCNYGNLTSTVLTYASVSATSIGISQNFSYYFISFINASSLVGRFAAGSISDRFGELFFLNILYRLFSSIR